MGSHAVAAWQARHRSQAAPGRWNTRSTTPQTRSPPEPASPAPLSFVGLDKLPIGIVAAQFPRERPHIVRLDRIGKRTRDHIAFGITRHGGDVSVEADGDARQLAFDRSV